jgi:DNA (cytosine-5)-methyltransferase 1
MIEYEIGTGMRYLSVCDGIGAIHAAWQSLGWSCVGVSEIAPFPKAVVKHRWGIRSLGDMKRFHEWPEKLLADVDVLVGGTPCQAFSVAGNRLGLADERGTLTLAFVNLYRHINRIRREYGRQPAILLWENVDGALSMEDNSFGCLVGSLLGCDEVPRTKGKGGEWPKAGLLCSETARVSWRVLDSANFAVAQRRKRVFTLGVPTELIERIGDRACPSQILSLRSLGELKSLQLKVRGGITQSSSVAKPRQSVDGFLDMPWLKGVPGSFSLPQGVSLSSVLETGPVDPKHYLTYMKGWKILRRAEVRGKQLPPLYERMLTDIAYGTRGIVGELAACEAMKDGDRVAWSIDGFNQSISEEVHHTLRVGRDSGDAVVVLTATSEVAGTLTATRGNGFRSNGLPTHGVAIEEDRGRTLTPCEWERLMGLPDGYTLVPYRKNELAKDSPRFTGLGNSIVVPILNWIGQRIDQLYSVDGLPGPQEPEKT